MPQSNADPATPHPSYFTTGRHRPPHGLRVTGLKNPSKPDKYRKIHTRSFSGYDQQLPNNLGEEERTRPQTATPPLGLQQNTSSRLKSPLNHAHSSCPNLSLFELACQTSPRPICASCANKRNLQHPLKRSWFYRPKHCLQTPLTHTSNHKKRGWQCLRSLVELEKIFAPTIIYSHLAHQPSSYNLKLAVMYLGSAFLSLNKPW